MAYNFTHGKGQELYLEVRFKARHKIDCQFLFKDIKLRNISFLQKHYGNKTIYNQTHSMH